MDWAHLQVRKQGIHSFLQLKTSHSVVFIHKIFLSEVRVEAFLCCFRPHIMAEILLNRLFPWMENLSMTVSISKAICFSVSPSFWCLSLPDVWRWSSAYGIPSLRRDTVAPFAFKTSRRTSHSHMSSSQCYLIYLMRLSLSCNNGTGEWQAS